MMTQIQISLATTKESLKTGLSLIVVLLIAMLSTSSSLFAEEILSYDTSSECVSNISANFSSDLLSVEAISDKGLSNVVLHFTDGSEQKFEINDGHNQYSLTFSGTGSNDGKTLVGVWIKSGCEKSGDGSGYGNYIQACESDITASITPLIIDAEAAAGAGTTSDYDFVITLNRAPTLCNITMHYEIDDGAGTYETATSSAIKNGSTEYSDYTDVSGDLLFDLNESTKTVTVVVFQDDVLEFQDEAFSVTLTNIANATFSNDTGVGVITREDP